MSAVPQHLSSVTQHSVPKVPQRAAVSDSLLQDARYGGVDHMWLSTAHPHSGCAPRGRSAPLAPCPLCLPVCDHLSQPWERDRDDQVTPSPGDLRNLLAHVQDSQLGMPRASMPFPLDRGGAPWRQRRPRCLPPHEDAGEASLATPVWPPK